MLINHVLSSETVSGIFNAIFEYFHKHSPPDLRYTITIHPDPRADIYHFHRPHLESHLPARSVATVHHDLYDPDPWLDFEKFRPRYLEAAHVVCLNRGQQRFLKTQGVLTTTVIPHGYNDAVLRPKVTSPRRRGHNRTTLGIFSKYYDRRFKGEAYLGDLVKHLDPRLFDFVLVGERRLITAESLAELGYQVRLYERLPYRLFQEAYEAIDYLLMCSTFEGGPANLPEAMATLTPILATPVGFAPDFLTDGHDSLFLTEDPEADAPRIMRLSDPSDSLTVAIDRGAAALAERVPTWTDVVERYVNLYRSIAEGRR
ncbi:MAG: glycosyltransferase [Myxococcales bacterium]|nr:glycosyltransferase [Myxococcales bacterium]